MALEDFVPLNFPVLASPRNWIFIAFIIFIVGALVHYLAPALASIPKTTPTA